MIFYLYTLPSCIVELKLTYFVEGPPTQAMGWMQPLFLPAGEKGVKGPLWPPKIGTYMDKSCGMRAVERRGTGQD